ncbi:P-loop NTPase fold protein [Halanaerobacter jeridensis]|uniref:KAP NTPase domain-containing protein n=1 Tax=Halanaerobacter jeridensis TaxID=706427 RepID=A0A938XXM8_9FIRM|nr:P-loop NTPase fold protein [Halanaerobacter jeridensis]MBM7558161.1 hypothetical protein [Halanaerobacter jeridensis]
MLKVKKAVLDYLEREETDYAILINGEWGSGKTYYWKNNLQTEINDEGYESIYVSLYGVTSLSEIGRKIFLSKMEDGLLSKLSGKLDDIGGEKINKLKEKGFELTKTLINVSDNKFGTNFKEEADLENLVDLEKSVLGFDDLERCNLPVEEIMGYINNFVEHDMIKTIIIANENEIYNPSLKQNVSSKIDIAKYFFKSEKTIEENIDEFDSKIKRIFSEYSHYKKIKEKLIGKTIEFSLTKEYCNEVIDNLISKFLDSEKNSKVEENINKKYNSFLESKKDIIIDTLYRSDKNIRSLKHGLADFKKIYSYLYENDLFDEIDDNLLIFTLAVSFEIRSGLYSKGELEKLIEYDLLYYSPSGLIYESDKNDYKEELEFIRKIINNYYQKGIDLYFSPMIFQYVMKGFLNKEELKREIKEIKEERKEIMKRREKNPKLESILNNWWNLDDSDFYSKIDDVIQNAEKGNYKLGVYPELFYNISKLAHYRVISKNLDELKEKFKDGIKVSRKKHSYDEISSISINSIETKFNLYKTNELESKYIEFCEEIKDFTLEQVEKILKKQKNKDIKEVAKLINSNPEEFFDCITSSKEYLFKPIIVYIDIDKFIENIKENKFSNEYITDLGNFLLHKYENGDLNKQYHGYEEKLCLLKERIDNYLDELENTDLKLRFYLVQRLSNSIDKITKELENNK